MKVPTSAQGEFQLEPLSHAPRSSISSLPSGEHDLETGRNMESSNSALLESDTAIKSKDTKSNANKITSIIANTKSKRRPPALILTVSNLVGSTTSGVTERIKSPQRLISHKAYTELKTKVE